jgi:hypothetical protein
MDWAMALFVLCSLAGLLMVVGSLALLWKGRIYLDTEGKSVSQVELPLGIKFGTQFPVLIMFLFGAFLLIFPVYYDKNICPDLALHSKTFPQMVKVIGKVNSPTKLDVYAIVDEQPNAQNDVVLWVPFKRDARYRVVFSSNDTELVSQPFTLEGLEPYVLREVKLEKPSETASPEATKNPVKTVADAEISKYK